ncbi:MAG: hypothetical protein ACOYJF_02250 [Prevotella sp.]|jgi:hypothetical protein
MKSYAIILLCLMTCLFASADNGNGKESHSNSFQFYEVIETSSDCEKALDQLRNVTFSKEQVVPGDPMTRTIINKGSIYEAVNTVRKGLQKQMREGSINKEEAEKEMSQVLKVAIAAFYADDSEDFEAALHKSRKNYQDLLKLFSSVKLKN